MIQKINANYLSTLDKECITAYIAILKLFLKATSSRNYRYGIIEYFYGISDTLSKKYIDDTALWIQLFSFLDNNRDEKDAEIRNTSLNIFAGIISNYGHEFTSDIWQYIMENIYLKSFDNIIETYFHLLREEMHSKSMPDTPDYVIQMKNDYDADAKIKKETLKRAALTKSEIETLSIQWQETIKVLIRTFNRILSKYLDYPDKTGEIIDKIFERSFYLFRITNKNVFNEVTTVIKNLLSSDSISKNKKQTLLLEIEKWLKRNSNQGQAVHDLMSILLIVFEDKSFMTDSKNFSIVLRIYSQVLYFSAYAAEYSTYFYNLELMGKSFMDKLLQFSVFNSNQDSENLRLLLDSIPELIVKKVENNKANTISLNIIDIIMTELTNKIQKISDELLLTFIDKLFEVNTLLFDSNYPKYIEKDKSTIYDAFYTKLSQLIVDLITRDSKTTLVSFLDTMLAKFIIINDTDKIDELGSLANVLRAEVRISGNVIYYLMELLKEDYSNLENLASKVFIYTKAFKYNCCLINKKLGDVIEKDVELEQKFSTMVTTYLQGYLCDKCEYGLKVKSLSVLAKNLQFNLLEIKNTANLPTGARTQYLQEMIQIIEIFTDFRCDEKLAKELISFESRLSSLIGNDQVDRLRYVHLMLIYEYICDIMKVVIDPEVNKSAAEYFKLVFDAFFKDGKDYNKGLN